MGPSHSHTLHPVSWNMPNAMKARDGTTSPISQR